MGGPTAEEADLRSATDRDTRLLVPLVLLVVFAILVLLLRSLAAPAMLMGTVVLSFLAAIGGSLLLFEAFADFPGEDPSYALISFIFLVALGVDYNIFLMARVREEATRGPTRQAMLTGLAVTGGVITSAGIVLAGTFAVLAVLPLVALTQVGVTVAFGVLLDTFVVRSVLVPALTWELGERTWWPRPPRAHREGNAEAGAVAEAASPGADESARAYSRGGAMGVVSGGTVRSSQDSRTGSPRQRAAESRPAGRSAPETSRLKLFSAEGFPRFPPVDRAADMATAGGPANEGVRARAQSSVSMRLRTASVTSGAASKAGSWMSSSLRKCTLISA